MHRFFKCHIKIYVKTRLFSTILMMVTVTVRFSDLLLLKVSSDHIVGNQQQSNSFILTISYANVYIIMLKIQLHNFKCIFLLDCRIILTNISMLLRSMNFDIMSMLSTCHCPFITISYAVKFHQTNSLYSLYITRNGCSVFK